MVLCIQTRLERLRHFPLSGAARDDLLPGLRAVVDAPYVAYYQTLPEAVVILRVLHGARDAAAIADRGGFES